MERFIEVKTTQMGIDTPFYFSNNELAFSTENANRYYLYRVFQFKIDPRLYLLQGALNETCNIWPVGYGGFPKSQAD